jgi:nucleoid-associated protein YgaU
MSTPIAERRGARYRRAAALLGLVSVPGAAALLGWAASAPLADVRAPGAAPVDTLVALGAAGGAGLTLVAVTASTLLTLLCGLRRRAGRPVPLALTRAAVALTPAVLRRLGEVALGLALVGAPASAAAAAVAPVRPPAVAVAAAGHSAAPLARIPSLDRPADDPDRPAPDRSVGATAAADPGWTPERPVAVRRATPAPVRLVAAAPRRAHARRKTVVVHRGDSLWRIVARYLGPTATAVNVSAEWPRWYAANRSVIGPDPDLLLPGQRLTPPAAHAN